MKRYIAGLVIAVFTLFMLLIVTGLVFGAPAYTDMDQYFIDHGQQQVAANNIVTSVVFDYRGFDTLGESAVLFTAVVGVALIFRRLEEDKP
jgi:multisubunit Na+/H+ antiporter MnhB subunit